jgi:type I restriction enzyme S subunit
MKNVNSRYLATFFKSVPYKRHIRKLLSGALINNLKNEYIDSLLIPDISDSDQLHIANLLSKAKNLIAQRKESIRLLDEFLKSTFLEMFGNNTANDKGWNKISLVDGCENKKDVKCGPFGTQLSKSEYRESGIPVWGIPQINSEFKILPREYVTELKAADLDEYSVVPNDIVMSRKGNVGKCSLFPKGLSKGIIHSDVLRIRTDKKMVHPVFLLFQLKHSKKIEMQIKGVTKGAIMAGINVGLLKHIIIDQPPIELQTQFAQIVEKTEAIKTQCQQSLQELENLYGSLSQKAFRGELGIKDEGLLSSAERSLSEVEVSQSMAAEPNIEY